MVTMLRIFPAETDDDVDWAKGLFFEYADFLKERFGDSVESDWAEQFRQRFEAEVDSLPGEYVAPKGCLLLAEYRGKKTGCVALRKVSEVVCEMRRLYVKRELRGLGIGKALVKAVIERARELGYHCMRLDTNRLLEAATGLYVSLGFEAVSPCEEILMEGMTRMELKLM